MVFLILKVLCVDKQSIEQYMFLSELFSTRLYLSFAGLPLGGEGPSVQVGGVIGQGVDQIV